MRRFLRGISRTPALFFLTCLTIFGCGDNQHSASKFGNSSFQIEKSTELTSQNANLSDQVLPVSIAPLSENRLLVATYNDILDVNLSKKSYELAIAPKIANWRPTGLYYAGKSQLLYVANYTGNNVLIFQVRLDGDRINLVLRNSISSKFLISPENISLNNSGNILATANYDGNSVTVFKKAFDKPEWNFKCKIPVNEAHGIAIVGSYLFATSLATREIIKANLDCSIEDQLGEVGWNSNSSQFLWPTSLFQFDANSLVLADAHQGTISLINIANLKTVSHFGSFGPGPEWLNFPYTSVRFKDSLWVASTFDKRLLRLNPNSLKGEDFYFTKAGLHPWRWLKSSPKSFLQSHPQNNYYYKDGQFISIAGVNYCLGYSSIRECNSRNQFELPFKSPFSPAGYFYWTEATQTSDGVLISSPAIGDILFMNESFLFPLDTGEKGVWKINDNLGTEFGPIYKTKIEQKISHILDCLGTDSPRFNGRGLNTLVSCVPLWKSKYSNAEDKVTNDFSNVFVSVPGKEFLHTLSSCWLNGCPQDVNSRAWNNYNASIQNLNYLPIDEYYLAKMVTE